MRFVEVQSGGNPERQASDGPCYLDALPLDISDIDRSFIGNIGVGRSSLILKASVQMGRSIGLSVIAEGVETEDQLPQLVRLMCDRLQAYLLAPSAPGETVPHLLKVTHRDKMAPFECEKVFLKVYLQRRCSSLQRDLLWMSDFAISRQVTPTPFQGAVSQTEPGNVSMAIGACTIVEVDYLRTC